MAQDGAHQDGQFPRSVYSETAFPEGSHDWAPQIRQLATQAVVRARRQELPPVTGVGWTEEFLVVPVSSQESTPQNGSPPGSARLEPVKELSPMPAVLAMQDWRQLVEWARPARSASLESPWLPAPSDSFAQSVLAQSVPAQTAPAQAGSIEHSTAPHSELPPTFEPVSKVERERFQARLEAETAGQALVFPSTASPRKASDPAPARLEDRMSPSLSGSMDPSSLNSTVAGASVAEAPALPASVPAQVLEVERDLLHATGPLRGRNSASSGARASAQELRPLDVEAEARATPAPTSTRAVPAVVFESPDPFASETFRTSRSTRTRDFVGREEVPPPARMGLETLVEIRELYRKGERDKAFQLLEGFLKVYPQHEAASKLYRALRAQRRAQTPSGHIDRAALLQAASDLATPEERALAEKHIHRQGDESAASTFSPAPLAPAVQPVAVPDAMDHTQIADEDLSSQDTFSVDFVPISPAPEPASGATSFQVPDHEYDLMVGPGLMIDAEEGRPMATSAPKAPVSTTPPTRNEPSSAPRLPFISHLDLSFAEEITDAGGRMSPLRSQPVEPLAFSLAEPGGFLGEPESNPDSEATDPRVRASLLGGQPASLEAPLFEVEPRDLEQRDAEQRDAHIALAPEAEASTAQHAESEGNNFQDGWLDAPLASTDSSEPLALETAGPVQAESPFQPPLTDSALMEISLFGAVLSSLGQQESLSQQAPENGAPFNEGSSLESVTEGEPSALLSSAEASQWQDELFMALDPRSGREFSPSSGDEDLSEYKTLQEPIPAPVLSDFPFEFQEEDPLAASAPTASAPPPPVELESLREGPSVLEPSELDPAAVAREVSSYEEALSALERSADRVGEQGGWGRVAPVTGIHRAIDTATPQVGGLSADAVLALEVSRLMQTRFVFSLEERLLLCALDGNRTWREATEFRGELSTERAEALLSSLMEEGSVKRIR